MRWDNKEKKIFIYGFLIFIMSCMPSCSNKKEEIHKVINEDAGLSLSNDYKLINYADNNFIDSTYIMQIKIPNNSIEKLKKQIMDRVASCPKYKNHKLSKIAKETSWWNPERKIFTTKYISKFSGIYIVISKDKDGTFLYIESKYLY